MNWPLIIFLLSVSLIGLVYYLRSTGYHFDSGTQHDLDMRLTYKRYKELYPNSPMSYQEYKEMQKKQAFRKSISSRKLKRMVR